MRAVQFARFGGPEVLELVQVPAPEPGPGVRVAVHTAGVNPLDWKLRSGAMNDTRPLALPHTPGLEFAGTVEAAGPDADFAVGDAVFGWSATGSYADAALAGVIAAKPAALSWRDAAALPVSGETSLRVLRELRIGSGDLLLIHGASGAVGSIATQLAVARGATVIGTAGRNGLDHVRSLGATPLTYGEGLVQRVRELAPDGVDAVFDAAGQGALPDSIDLRGGKDRIVTIADPAAFALGIRFSSGDEGGPDASLLTELATEVIAGRLRITHSAEFPLERAGAAHALSETGHSRGKITLAVAG